MYYYHENLRRIPVRDARPHVIITSPENCGEAHSLADNEEQQISTPGASTARVQMQALRKDRKNRSPGTVQSYEYHARAFIERFLEECFPAALKSSFPDLSPQEWARFPSWFASSYHNAPWCRQTLKIVKVSLCYVLGSVLDKDGLEDIRNFSPCTVKEKGSMCMALHDKNPDISRIRSILAWLDAHNTFLAGIAAAWFRAEIVTGLRTKEWRYASYKENETGGTLTIINGKQNDMLSQGSGFARHLVYRGPEHEASRRILRKFFTMKEEYFRQFTEDKGYTEDKCFARMQRNCQKMYRRANMLLRMGRKVSVQEKNITLYSLRDAFKADAFNLMKADPERRRDIAALMGHSSLVSQDMYAPEHRTLGRRFMPAAAGRNETNTKQFLQQDSRIQEDANARTSNRLEGETAYFAPGQAQMP